MHSTDVPASPILSCPLYCIKTIGAAIHTHPKDVVQRIKKSAKICPWPLHSVKTIRRYSAHTTTLITLKLADKMGSTDRKRKIRQNQDEIQIK
jgi:hypothetical protein